MLRAVKPCCRELREDFSFVSADLGPRDLAPLARAVSDRSLLGMALFSIPVYRAFGVWQEGGFCRLLKLGEIYFWIRRDWVFICGLFME